MEYSIIRGKGAITLIELVCLENHKDIHMYSYHIKTPYKFI